MCSGGWFCFVLLNEFGTQLHLPTSLLILAWTSQEAAHILAGGANARVGLV